MFDDAMPFVNCERARIVALGAESFILRQKKLARLVLVGLVFCGYAPAIIKLMISKPLIVTRPNIKRAGGLGTFGVVAVRSRCRPTVAEIAAHIDTSKRRAQWNQF